MQSAQGFRSMVPGRLPALLVICFASVLLCAPAPVQAQGGPTLILRRLTAAWPRIELGISVTCNGTPVGVSDKSVFHVYENGVEVPAFTLSCPDPASSAPAGVSLVIDRSFATTTGALSSELACAHAFIDMGDPQRDEFGVIAFDTTPQMLVDPMTGDKTYLHGAVNGITVQMRTAAVWDAAWAGVQQAARSTKTNRSVVLLTAGSEYNSVHTRDALVREAVLRGIPLHIIGCGTVHDPDTLAALATATGGKYLENPSPAQLASFYVSTLTAPGECRITYTASCMDGALRTVDLSLVNFCGGSAMQTKSYRAPRDTTTFMPVRIAVASASVRGGGTVTIPITTSDVFTNEFLHPAMFEIAFDAQCAQLTELSTTGTLLAGVPVSVTRTAAGVTVETKDRALLNGTGHLFELTFLASDPDGSDTICCPVVLQNWRFASGCRKPVLSPGRICIPPRRPLVTASIFTSEVLRWDAASKDYSPNPFTFTVTLSNSGDREARGARLTLACDAADLALVSPVSKVQSTTPSYVPAGGSSSAQWSLRALPRRTGDSVAVTITASFDNHPDITVVQRIRIPASPVPVIEVSGRTSFCPGGSVVLSVRESDQPRRWSTGDTARSITVYASGAYTVMVTDTSGVAYTSAPVTVTELPVPVPVVTRNGMQLTCTPAAVTYQWSRNGAPIPGETHQTLTITGLGFYQVTVTDTNGCIGLSYPFDATTAVDLARAVPTLYVAAFPEPNHGSVSLRLAHAHGAVDVVVCDLLGRVRMVLRDDASSASPERVLDLSSLPAGVYVCRVTSGADVRVLRLTRW